MIMARELSEDKSRKLISSSVGDCDFFYTDSSSSREKSRKWIGPTGDCDYFLCTDVSSSSTPTIQTQFGNQIQTGFESNPEIFNLSTSMEMIGFSKQGNHHQLSGPSSSKTINESTSDFHQQSFNNKQDFTTGISETSSDQNLMVGPDQSGPWQENRFLVDDSSLRCVFPCEGNERPSQGLSLSLSSTNPSSIGLQSFELRQTNHHQHQDGLFGKSENIQQQQMIQDGFLGKAANLHHQVHFQLRNSKYLAPVQELLNEFCSLGTKLNDSSKQKSHKNKQWEDDNGGSSSKNKALHSLEFMELQKRKTKLLSMLEEVERRYKIYCDQMKAVVSLFEGVAGAGAATVYSALASKAMSRHFRCLKDGILNQLQATRKAMGEKDPVAPGTTRGETPRLRILDQTLRQQRAYQQMTMMETHPWRPQRGLPERSVSVLRAWLFEHFLHPYPSDVDKHILARQTGLSRSQVSNWFINARVRLWKPMVEEMYVEETKLQEDLENSNINMASTSDGIMDHLGETSRAGGHHPPPPRPEDQKPTPDQLVRIDSECLSSIVINPEKNDNRSNKALQNHNMQRQQNFGRIGESTFGTMELDFSSYNHHHSSAAGTLLYPNQDHHHANQGFNGSGSGGGGVGGVSLTLGLQQHGGSGVSLAFSPASQRSLFYPRDHVEGCDPANEIDYSLLDGEGQNLPYRNLMGAQLLHDLA